jgi:hypothetical protein
MKTEEKKEFWCWPFLLLGLIFSIVILYRSYQMDKAIWAASKEVSVLVFDKKRVGRNTKIIMAYHNHTAIQVNAGNRWFRQARIGSGTWVRYSPKYNAYIDRYHKFEVDRYFLIFMSSMCAIILWRAIWLGLYIWYWKV